MRVNEDYETWNAAVQVNDPDSVRSFWKEALQHRKKYDVLVRLFVHGSPSPLIPRLITIAAFPTDLWWLCRHRPPARTNIRLHSDPWKCLGTRRFELHGRRGLLRTG